jgi:putative DNA primase/helicase
LTGGDKITARFMRQDFFEYTPQFKLMIAGNHRPSLTSVDEAIRRRIHLIPFTVTIPPEKRNLKLGDELRKEWGGILKWAVAGCLEWQRIGLGPPAAVLDATADYLTAEDGFGRWIDECCVVGNHQWGVGSRLWDSWKSWSQRNNERTGSRKGFAESMKTHGYQLSKSQEVRGYSSINLNRPADDEQADLDEMDGDKAKRRREN